MGNIAIIPARGGSKRIPGKNVRDFLGKPIIAYSIVSALESDLFDEVMVSTDDPYIADVAKKYGASVPFMRSGRNADDFATTSDVLLEVLENYNEQGKSFDNACCIYPTAPFTTAARLSEALALLENTGADCVFPVMPYSFPIQRALRMKDDRVSFFLPEHQNARSQDLETAYHDSGQFYFFKTDVLLETGRVLTENTAAVIISELEAQDIDNETDWRIAELKYKLVNAR